MPVEIINPENAFELKTTRQDLLADVVFLIGTLISLNQNIETEEKIVNPGENRTSGVNAASANNAPLGLGPLVLTLFLIATSILAFTSIERLDKQKAEAVNSVNQTTANNIRGGETVILGQFVRILGYIISIMGERIKAANPV